MADDCENQKPEETQSPAEAQAPANPTEPREGAKAGGGAHLAPKDKKSHKGLIIAVVIVIVALVGVIVYLLVGRNNTEIVDEDTPRRAVVVNEESAAEIVESLIEQEPVRAGSYRAKMNSTWNFANGEAASSNAYVENVEANTNDVYFDVELADTGEVIYQSPVIPRGAYLNNIALDTPLPAGTYDCVLTYHLVDENQETVSTLRMTLTVVVES